jgi:hypothetical protein
MLQAFEWVRRRVERERGKEEKKWAMRWERVP